MTGGLITYDKRGYPIECGHAGCSRPAVRIIAAEAPNHREFKGQAHDCCSVHSRPPKPPPCCDSSEEKCERCGECLSCNRCTGCDECLNCNTCNVCSDCASCSECESCGDCPSSCACENCGGCSEQCGCDEDEEDDAS